MSEQRINKLEIAQAVSDNKMDNLIQKIDDMPQNIVNEVKLIMISEARKTSDGLGQEVTRLKANQKWIIAIGAGVAEFIHKLF